MCTTQFYQKGKKSVVLFTGFSFFVIQLLLDRRNLGLQSGILGVPSLVPLFLALQVLLHCGDLGYPSPLFHIILKNIMEPLECACAGVRRVVAMDPNAFLKQRIPHLCRLLMSSRLSTKCSTCARSLSTHSGASWWVFRCRRRRSTASSP